ncbi:MAG: uridine kinase [Lachnospiraceae bacterium]|nr:uridine kinase [Lachnospiraceae bacterium]
MILKLGDRKIHIYKFHILVFAVTVLKILLMCMCSSDYQNKLFIPFLTYFVTEGGDPYQHFYETGNINAFPYPAVMLAIASLGAVLVRMWGITSVCAVNFLYKLPSLLLDYAGLYWLVRMFPDRKKYAAVFYFSSPMILYAVYMHGQFDLIPTVLLLGAVYYFSSKEGHRNLKGTVLLAGAVLSKLHILAVLPVIFLYLYKRDGIRETAKSASGTFLLTALGFLPFMSEGFINMVLMNSEQKILTQVSFTLATAQMYIPIVTILIVYLITYSMNVINRDLFVNLCGIVFISLLAVCPPMPGWYVWIVPYITLFFANINEAKYKNMVIYVFLNVLYLVYFIFLHDRGAVDLYLLDIDLSFVKIGSRMFANILFTLLAGTLFYIIFSMYQLGVTNSTFYKRRNLPFTIGIAGDSGAGKSTFIHIVAETLGEKNLLFIEGDGDHRWERGDIHWEENTHLNPKANYLYRQASNLSYLRAGVPVRRVEYDHDTGKFTEAKKIRPNKYIMMCGLHSLYLPQMRKNIDLKIYMDVDEDLRRFWKIQRDTVHRGYSKEEILKQIEDRIPDAEKYIYPQKEYADIVIHYYDRHLKDCMADGHDVRLSAQITVSAAIDVEPLLAELTGGGYEVSYDYSEDLQMQTIDIAEFEQEHPNICVEEIAGRLIPQLEAITRERLTDTNGIMKLFLLMVISSKMRGEI